MDDLKDKIKTANPIETIHKYWYVPISLVIISFIFIAYTYGTYKPSSNVVTSLVDQQLKIEKEKLEKELKAAKNTYENTVKEKDVQIGELQKKIGASQVNINSAKTEIARLKGELANAIPPKNVEESRKRLQAHGFNTF